MMRAVLRLSLVLSLVAAWCCADAAEVADVAIPHSPEAVRRGAEVVSNVCMTCHNLKYVKYGNLAQLGFGRKELDTLRSGKSLKKALLSAMGPDMLRESFGKVPPDLSLMAHAREGGPAYIYSLLTGFYQKPDGSVDNHVFPGIKMPDVLNYSAATDATQRAPLQKQAKDAAAFLDWAADPHAAERHHLGYYVMAYLVVLTILLYLTKHRIWARLDRET
ncbi:MAG: cytochrome c1 [Gammaproteobacteria bacterium]|jgi:ubiquinol-cytochrome c reductase cytochrome c1 subunit